MKLTTAAVLASGITVSLATAVVGAAWLWQDTRHQAKPKEVIVAPNQLDCLAEISTTADLAKPGMPKEADVELGFIPGNHLPFSATTVISGAACQHHWHRPGSLPAQEVKDDARAKPFTHVLDQAAKKPPQTQAASI
ncbi:peptide transporter permease SapC [Streptomyces sp. 8L]|uniref:peptide transporter permease SapC n=1 Tax=Streptomyces sp. 8L TaxID=2877242 RepID=UPI001CD1E6FA|nr:peptide transporter permease SapC [Streptomyces sp. 8L]MCA1220054.1 peptide transporter permease SapC [Streptomyces sp. 8L]